MVPLMNKIFCNLYLKFIFIVYLLSFNSFSQANDINDFQIEGIGIGESFLTFFTKKQIKNFINYDELPSDMKYRISEFDENQYNMETYTAVQIYHKPNDDKHTIHGVRGAKSCSSEKECETLYKNIKNDLLEVFHTGIEETHSPQDDPSGSSKTTYYEIELDNGNINIAYNNWSENVQWYDNVSVEVSTKDVDKWIRNNYGLGWN